ncbi:MAG: hypothetical protein EXR99_16650 [Gemmataceae bacterium]|nr:hypothetical protein [Gemmataceae bacterium]
MVTATKFILPKVLFFGRTYEEYLEMFALENKQLQGRDILDCPSGPDSFVAQGQERGLHITGCDPMYYHRKGFLGKQARLDIKAGVNCMRNLLNELFVEPDWEEYLQRKLLALKEFSRDFSCGLREGRYIPGALPSLPFKNRAFDLALSGNFLFSYADTKFGGTMKKSPFDLHFHRMAVQELLRVARREVRIYPLYTLEIPSKQSPLVAPLVEELKQQGYRVDLIPSRYNHVQTNFNSVLVIKK